MKYYWNIRESKGFNCFRREVKSLANKNVADDILYFTRPTYEIDKKHPQKRYPLLIPRGEKINRKMAYMLVRYYCNKNDVYYAGNDLDELVDELFGMKKENSTIIYDANKKLLEKKVVNLNAYSKLKAEESYIAEYNRKIEQEGNPWMRRIA